MPSFEVLLVVGVLGFYLYDAGMLLYVNEMLFLRGHKRWVFAYPGNTWLVLGRSPYVPNPLTPDLPVFRVHWSEKAQGAHNSYELVEQFVAALRPIRYLLQLLFCQFFVALPLVLFMFGSGTPLLWVFAGVYLNISAILAVVYKKRDALGLSKRKFMALALESFACAPFALNVLRKLTLQHTLAGDPIEFAKGAFDRGVYLDLVDAVSKRIDEELELVDVEAPRYEPLKAYKSKIQEIN